MGCQREGAYPRHEVLRREALVADGGCCGGLRLYALLALLVPPRDRQERHAQIPRGSQRLRVCIQCYSEELMVEHMVRGVI